MCIGEKTGRVGDDPTTWKKIQSLTTRVPPHFITKDEVQNPTLKGRRVKEKYSVFSSS